MSVRLERLSKVYRVYARPLDRVRETITRRARHREHRALQDVSLEVAPGEGFGIIGENGAGKSTLLKIVAGVTAPTSGRAIVSGTVASILELGGGFHPELTGRQNIVLSAALLGLSEREVRARTPAIIEFSELGEVLDEPIRCYSTGMSMRLAFAIAIQVQPDVLIVDEALSVGDGYFQRKCLQRMQAFIRDGGTLLFSSHAMYYVSEFCSRALWLREGRVAALGPAVSVIREYEAFLTAKAAPVVPATDDAASETGLSRRRGPARLATVTPAALVADHEAPWSLDIGWTSEDPRLGFHLAVGIDRVDGVQAFACSTRHDRLAPLSGRHAYQMRLTVPALPLCKGRFTAYVFLLDEEARHVYDRRVLPDVLDVTAPEYMAGMFAVAHEWAQVEENASERSQNRSLSPQV